MKTSRYGAGRETEAFTLVELMVVVGIIGLLIALILPAVGAARTAARSGTTKAVISTIETGVEQYRLDSRVGGSLPPSRLIEPQQLKNPHRQDNSSFPAATGPLGGATFLAWALAGADLAGTPGFIDLEGGSNWMDNVGALNVPCSQEPGSAPLYSYYPPNCSPPHTARSGKPVYPRSGPFVDISKVSLPKAIRDSTGGIQGFELSETRTKETLPSIAFLDTFGQPILYYKAETAGSVIASTFYRPNEPIGVYIQSDNANITGGAGYAGKDLGGGKINTYGDLHYLGIMGTGLGNNPQDWPRCFQKAICNFESVAGGGAQFKPHRPDSFLLISAGPDAIYGSTDDIANYKVNP